MVSRYEKNLQIIEANKTKKQKKAEKKAEKKKEETPKKESKLSK